MAKKNTQINIRVSEEAKQLITNNAKLLGMKQGEYIETIARKGINKIVEVTHPELMNKYATIMNAMDKQGKNLNQISTKLNSGKLSLTESDIEAFEKLTRLFQLVYNCIHKEEEYAILFMNNEEE